MAFGQFPEPVHIGGVESSAIHPNPTVGAYPFCSHFDIRMTAGNGHHDVIRILAVDPILGASVPDRILWRKFTCALDLKRAASLVHIQAPMGNIAMVPDPIQQLASTGVVIPTPIHVHA